MSAFVSIKTNHFNERGRFHARQASRDPVQKESEPQLELLLRRGLLLVLWDARDPFDGEDQPPLTVTWPWPAEQATVTDAFGQSGAVPVQDCQLRLPVTDTPLLIESRPVP